MGVAREVGVVPWLSSRHETNCSSLLPLFKYIPLFLLLLLLLLFGFVLPKMNRVGFAH